MGEAADWCSAQGGNASLFAFDAWHVAISMHVGRDLGHFCAELEINQGLHMLLHGCDPIQILGWVSD